MLVQLLTFTLDIREGIININDAYEAKNDMANLLRRNPRFKTINEKVHTYFYIDKAQKNSLQPRVLDKEADGILKFILFTDFIY